MMVLSLMLGMFSMNGGVAIHEDEAPPYPPPE